MNLKPKQLKAAAMLAEGQTGREVAEAVSVSPQTISDWRRNPEFVATINGLRREAIEAARDRLQHAAQSAVATLLDVAESAANNETRRKAALDIIRLCGFEPGHHETFGWGAGSTNPKQIEQEMKRAKMSPNSALFNELADLGF